MATQPNESAQGGIFAALAKAQSKIAAPSKNREVSVKMKTGGTYKFKYATLDHLIEHVRPALTSNGLWFVQKTEPGAMVTRITHESGEFIDSAVPMPNLPNSPQEAGSILTYFRRYSLSVALGLASDEDDDANVAEGNGYEPRGTVSLTAPISDADWAMLAQLIEVTKANVPAMLKHLRIVLPDNNLDLLNQQQFKRVIAALNDKLAKMAKAETDAKAKEEVQ